MSLLNIIWVYGGLAWATFVCGMTCWLGGTAERIGGVTVWLAWVLSLVLFVPGPKGPGIATTIIDCTALAVFVILSLRTRRLWTVFAAACQLDDIMSHVVAQLSHFQLYSHIVAAGIWGGEGLLACLIAGTIGYRRRLKRAARLAAAWSPASSDAGDHAGLEQRFGRVKTPL